MTTQLDKSKLAMIVAECGSGKTKIGAAALYTVLRTEHKIGLKIPAIYIVFAVCLMVMLKQSTTKKIKRYQKEAAAICRSV